MKHILEKSLEVVRSVLHILYPVRCPLCDELVNRGKEPGGYPVCSKCRETAKRAKEPVCKKCGKPLTDTRREYCADCNFHPHYFEQGKALWVHQGKVKESVYRLKYHNRREYGKSFGQEMAKEYAGWIRRKGIQGIIPIPLHKKRRWQRGYNQAEIIAKELGKQLQLPVYTEVLKRSIDTKPQKELDNKERKENLKRAFDADIGKLPQNVTCVLLVDDIYTTGSTMDGAARALKSAKVKNVYSLCVSIGKGH